MTIWWKTFEAKLFTAFVGIAILILFSTGFALYLFSKFGKAVDHTTDETMPEMVAAMRLSEHCATLAAVSPVLAASGDEEELRQTAARIDYLMKDIHKDVSFLSDRGGGKHGKIISQISSTSGKISEILSALKSGTLRHLGLKKELKSVLSEIQKTHGDFADTVSPVMYGTSSLASLLGKRTARQIASAVKSVEKTQDTEAAYKEILSFAQKSVGELTEGAIRDMGYALEIKAEGNFLFAILHAVSEADRADTLTDIHNRFKVSHAAFRQAAAIFSESALARRNPVLANNVRDIDDRIFGMSEGEKGIFLLVGNIISGKEALGKKLSESREIAGLMTKQVDGLVTRVQDDMTVLQKSMKTSKRAGASVLLLICSGCLLSSALIAGFTIRVMSRHERDIVSAKENAEHAKIIAENTNKKITDSIQYAKTIQRSLLPNPEHVKTYLPGSFFLWMPRDIVGGDILFTESVENGCIVAVIDCTGHGVPGAFMTLIASSAMTRIIRDEGNRDPGEILKRLSFIVKTSLQQDKKYTLSNDGLDAAVCFMKFPAPSFSKGEKSPLSGEKGILTFAGAKIPLYYVYNGEINIIKGDRQSIGYKHSDLSFNFTNHTVPVENGMYFYMFSDGFTDQLGGDRRRRFGSKKLTDLLTENVGQSFEKQKEILLGAFYSHKGGEDQQDDVTGVGFGL